MKVWLVIDSESDSGQQAIKGIFVSKEKAKMFIADYVLENDVCTSCLELAQMEVEE